jgi:hypothetical protein
MGMGKTYLAIAVALSLIDTYKPLILLPKSLEINFKHSVSTAIDLLNSDKSKEEISALKRKLIGKFEFLSTNANNVGAKMSTIPTGLDNRLIIVDEAHNLFRAMINSGGKDTNNAKKIYDAIMKAKNIKLLFLSGTPCSKDPFEMVPCFNMLAGYELLPSQYSVWSELFLSKDGKSLINMDKLANRLFGLVSFAELKDPELFPEQLPVVVETVEMSSEQYHKYLQARQKEKSEMSEMEENRRSKPLVVPSLSLPSSSEAFGTYYVKSRMLSNYCKLGGPDDELNVKEEAPKVFKLVQNIEISPGPVVIYSQFVNKGGIGTIMDYLDTLGYTNYNKLGTKSGGKTYAYIAGDVSEEQQKSIEKIFKNKDNMHGDVIKILLISKKGAEGLSLKYIRQVHILEPYWDYSRINQVIARAVRLGSHVDLPPEERTVQPYIYLSIQNKEAWESMPPKSRELQTTDQLFYSRAIQKEKLNESGRSILKSVCIECQFLDLPNCRKCKPTGEHLFTKNIRNDIKNADPCIEVEELQLDLEEIEHDGITYYYKKATSDESPVGYVFYKYDKVLDAYVPIDFSDPIINELTEIIDPFVM